MTATIKTTMQLAKENHGSAVEIHEMEIGRDYVCVYSEGISDVGKVYTMDSDDLGLFALFELVEPAKVIGEKADRFNEGKPQLSFILDAPNAIEELSKVFEMGAKKYDRDNWKKGLESKQVIDSLLRHLTAYANGEGKDDESGLHHTAHVLWNALVLCEQDIRKVGYENGKERCLPARV